MFKKKVFITEIRKHLNVNQQKSYNNRTYLWTATEALKLIRQISLTRLWKESCHIKQKKSSL